MNLPVMAETMSITMYGVWGVHGCERIPFDSFVGKSSIPVESCPVTDYNESHLMFVDLGNGYLLVNTDM